MHAFCRSALVALAGLAGGCAVGPRYHAPDPAAPRAFAAATDTGVAPAGADELAGWWHQLNDPELDALVERAIRSNPDIAIALARLQQARTYETVVLGHALPEVDAAGAAGRGTGSDLTRSRAAQPLVSADNASGLQHINSLAGFDAVWEIDLFGKYRREMEAAHYDTQAAAAARKGVLISVIADVVRAYVDLRGFQARAAILGKADEALRESLRIVTIRYQRGITNELDVTLAERELAALEAEIAPANAAARAAAYTLATLVGEYPEALTAELARPGLVPEMPGAVTPGLPIEVLKRRPDVEEAERGLAAATARIGVATANLFPQIGLVGAIGVEGQGWGTTPVARRHIWSFGPGAIWPLLDVGALDAAVSIADLETQARLAGYRGTLWNAVREVDAAVDEFGAERERLGHLDEGVVAGTRAVVLATERYNRGLTDFLNLVDAERQLYELEGQYVTAQMAAADAFVQLYKSLGGGWQNYQSVPPVRRPLPAVVAAFREVLSGRAP